MASERVGIPPLNLQPVGLLGFLGIKNGGQYPQQLIPTLQPTIDLWEHYCATNANQVNSQVLQFVADQVNTDFIISATTPVDLCTGGRLVVPQTEVWFLQDASVLWGISSAASQLVDAGLSILLQGGSYRYPAMTPTVGWNESDPTAAVSFGGNRALMRPQWLSPGSELQIYIAGIALAGGGSASVQANMRIVRLPA